MSIDSHPVDIHVGARLALAMKLRSLSRRELASRLGVSYQQIQKYEAADNRISASKLWELSEAMQLPVSWFFEDIPGAEHSVKHPIEDEDQEKKQMILAMLDSLTEHQRGVAVSVIQALLGVGAPEDE